MNLFDLIEIQGNEENLPKESGSYICSDKTAGLGIYSFNGSDKDKQTFIKRIDWYLAPVEVDDWVSVKDRLPTEEDADENGRVMTYLRKDRQWSWPGGKGHSKWDRVTTTTHTHWRKLPPPPQSTIKTDTK